MLILITNDDGILARGLTALADAMRALGEVWVIAPDRERSATSHAISLDDALRLREMGERTFAASGTPVDCVYLGLNHVLPRPPDLVVSGINHGGNLGTDTLYSGTVHAAAEASLYGFRALAVSAVKPTAQAIETAAVFARETARWLTQAPVRDNMLINVNVPDIPVAEIRYQWTTLGRRRYAEEVHQRTDPRGRYYYFMGGSVTGFDEIPLSDCNAIAQNVISVTPMALDMTDHAGLRALGHVRLGDFACVDPDTPL